MTHPWEEKGMNKGSHSIQYVIDSGMVLRATTYSTF